MAHAQFESPDRALRSALTSAPRNATTRVSAPAHHRRCWPHASRNHHGRAKPSSTAETIHCDFLVAARPMAILAAMINRRDRNPPAHPAPPRCVLRSPAHVTDLLSLFPPRSPLAIALLVVTATPKPRPSIPSTRRRRSALAPARHASRLAPSPSPEVVDSALCSQSADARGVSQRPRPGRARRV